MFYICRDSFTNLLGASCTNTYTHMHILIFIPTHTEDASQNPHTKGALKNLSGLCEAPYTGFIKALHRGVLQSSHKEVALQRSYTEGLHKGLRGFVHIYIHTYMHTYICTFGHFSYRYRGCFTKPTNRGGFAKPL